MTFEQIAEAAQLIAQWERFDLLQGELNHPDAAVEMIFRTGISHVDTFNLTSAEASEYLSQRQDTLARRLIALGGVMSEGGPVPGPALEQINADLMTALNEIGTRPLTSEMTQEVTQHVWFPGVYDTMIKAARAAIRGVK